jgi:hypothetical protein
MKRKGKMMETQKFSLTIPDDKQRIEDLLGELLQVRAEKTEALDKLIKVEAEYRRYRSENAKLVERMSDPLHVVTVDQSKDIQRLVDENTLLRSRVDMLRDQWADKTPSEIRAVEDVKATREALEKSRKAKIGQCEEGEPVKTLRDEIAMAILPVLRNIDDGEGTIPGMARDSYRYADAMMKARAGE